MSLHPGNKGEVTGGKTQQLGISKRGDTYLRTLLIASARAVIARSGQSDWIEWLLQRRHYNVVVVALANKMARTAWAILARGMAFDPHRRDVAVRRGEMQIVAAVAAHHRLIQMHPFADGNGRVARLHTLAVLQSIELAPGLWSLLRGLARGGDRYSQRLGDANQFRHDAPGPLSERMLVAWLYFFLDVCLDEVSFMQRMFNLREMQDRLKALLAHEEQAGKRGLRREALRPLRYLFATQGAITRGDFARDRSWRTHCHDAHSKIAGGRAAAIELTARPGAFWHSDGCVAVSIAKSVAGSRAATPSELTG